MLSVVRRDLEKLVEKVSIAIASEHPATLTKTRVACLGLWIEEPSTRNRISCQRVAYDLGMGVISIPSRDELAIAKGEALDETFGVLGRYIDCFAMRTTRASGPLMGHHWSGRPVLNIGDGSNEHPSQGMSVLCALMEHGVRPGKATVALYGDVDRSRTARSVGLGIAVLGGIVLVIDNGIVDNGRGLQETVLGLGLSGRVALNVALDEVDADALYLWRVQSERYGGEIPAVRPLSSRDLGRFKMVLHPLPRGPELTPDGWAAIREELFRHVERTLRVRRELVRALVDGEILCRESVERAGPEIFADAPWRCGNEDCLLSDCDSSANVSLTEDRCPGCHSAIRR